MESLWLFSVSAAGTQPLSSLNTIWSSTSPLNTVLDLVNNEGKLLSSRVCTVKIWTVFIQPHWERTWPVAPRWYDFETPDLEDCWDKAVCQAGSTRRHRLTCLKLWSMGVLNVCRSAGADWFVCYDCPNTGGTLLQGHSQSVVDVHTQTFCTPSHTEPNHR